MSEKEFPCPDPPEPNKCGGYYCSEEHGHIDCQLNPDGTPKVLRHFDCTPGLTMEGVVFELLPNHGKPCWKASAQIGTIFGSEVHGELIGFGPTKEAALEKLHDEQRKLHESLWE